MTTKPEHDNAAGDALDRLMAGSRSTSDYLAVKEALAASHREPSVRGEVIAYACIKDGNLLTTVRGIRPAESWKAEGEGRSIRPLIYGDITPPQPADTTAGQAVTDAQILSAVKHSDGAKALAFMVVGEATAKDVQRAVVSIVRTALAAIAPEPATAGDEWQAGFEAGVKLGHPKVKELLSDSLKKATPAAADAVYLVPTDHVSDDGKRELYERYEGMPPANCDFERLYTAPAAAVPDGWIRADDQLPACLDGDIRSERVLVTDGRRIDIDVAYYDWKPQEHDFMKERFGPFKPKFYSWNRWLPLDRAIQLLAAAPANRGSDKERRSGPAEKRAVSGIDFRWTEVWRGSPPRRGWYIYEGSGLATDRRIVSCLGDHQIEKSVREIVQAHNTALLAASPADPLAASEVSP